MPVSALTFAGSGTTLPTDVSSVACGTSSIPASMHSSSELLDELEDDTHSPQRTVSICGKQDDKQASEPHNSLRHSLRFTQE